MAEILPTENEDADLRTAAQKRAEQEVMACWEKVAGTYEGRTVLWEILSWCGMYRDCPPGDAADMAHFLGRRNIGLKMDLYLLTVDINSVTTMRSEALLRQQRANSDG